MFCKCNSPNIIVGKVCFPNDLKPVFTVPVNNICLKCLEKEENWFNKDIKQALFIFAKAFGINNLPTNGLLLFDGQTIPIEINQFK